MGNHSKNNEYPPPTAGFGAGFGQPPPIGFGQPSPNGFGQPPPYYPSQPMGQSFAPPYPANPSNLPPLPTGPQQVPTAPPLANVASGIPPQVNVAGVAYPNRSYPYYPGPANVAYSSPNYYGQAPVVVQRECEQDRHHRRGFLHNILFDDCHSHHSRHHHHHRHHCD
ncbi:hypothetical protein M3Y98_01165400 [Aphelenchoides besseyi]|nr:hypothetical protein M3Y98_01165400 [Aphelenchoides besseyi]KAI6210910.1 hypothetical protein M3Y96_00377800 [Aphelenchoides besseyi]